ncbi:hypothetical protein T02_458 [Trichinella nativa]|uniref:Uncharacterized protein n=1 Tax=Trichinella nativa TaxID=6335 RepID=A0A0V1KNG2_9BILA|nr:hypothetical protein T02_15963 [Trichinella nativa]KRZ48736.1 hypothetical protein T02_5159 [Trichinella nativa]KRZ51418.1 hypothetical protein T02_458 [Trichinella nativa]
MIVNVAEWRTGGHKAEPRLATIEISVRPHILCPDTLREVTCYLSKQDLLYLKRLRRFHGKFMQI